MWPPTAVAVLAAVVLAGCGSGTSSTASGPASTAATSAGPLETTSVAKTGRSAPKDACTLVTAAEAEAAIGGTVGPAKAVSPKAGGSGCNYGQTPVTVASGILSIVVEPAQVNFQALQGQFSDTHPLPGVGDEAFYTFQAGVAGADAAVRVGSTVVVLLLGATASDTLPARIQALAAVVAGRL